MIVARFPLSPYIFCDRVLFAKYFEILIKLVQNLISNLSSDNIQYYRYYLDKINLTHLTECVKENINFNSEFYMC